MKVCVDGKILFENRFHSDYSHYLLDAFRRIEKENPQVQFCFLAGQFPENGNVYPKNNQVLVVKCLPGITGWKIWNRLQVPAMIKKVGAAILIKPDGICIPKPSLPQIVWLPGNDRYFVNKKFSSWFQRELEMTTRNASMIITDTERTAQFIREKFQWTNNLQVFPPVPDIPEPNLSWTDREKIRNNLANGKEFFLLRSGPTTEVELKSILQGFSLFKKMQRSNMQLVITGISDAFLQRVAGVLENFRLRHDVHVYHEKSIPDINLILQSAYALLLPFADNFIVANAYSCQVPVITGANGKEQPINKGISIPADFADSQTIGDLLMKIYKNEAFRDQLIREGNLQLAHNKELADPKTLSQRIIKLFPKSSI